jgi:DNA-binding response OmpR family regulator
MAPFMLRLTSMISGLTTILVVDDDATTTGDFVSALRFAGYDAHAALSAAEARTILRCHDIDVCLLDLHLPETNGGLAFLREARQERFGESMAVAIITGDYFLDDAVTNEATRLGARIAYKPLWIEDVMKLVTSLITRPEMERLASSWPPRTSDGAGLDAQLRPSR